MNPISLNFAKTQNPVNIQEDGGTELEETKLIQTVN
jgi:hypothetical protein